MSREEDIKEELKKNPSLMLDELLKKISEKYWVKLENIKLLSLVESKKWLEWLKNQLKNIDKESDDWLKNISEEKLKEIFFALKWAKEIISKISEKERNTLKEELDCNNDAINKQKYLSDKLLPTKLIYRAKNPKNVRDNILWMCLWVINSGEIIISVSVDLLIWIWKWLYDLYLVWTWKAEYKIKWKV